MEQLLAHLVGDYILQSHYMATEKVRQSVAAAIHALCYTIPFLFLTRAPAALAVICGTHFVIDRFRLARYVVYAKNLLAPVRRSHCLEHPRSCDGKDDGCCCADRHLARSRLGRPFGLGTDGPEMSFSTSGLVVWPEFTATGYPPDVPPWLAVWLLILADNCLHLLLNYGALRWLT